MYLLQYLYCWREEELKGAVDIDEIALVKQSGEHVISGNKEWLKTYPFQNVHSFWSTFFSGKLNQFDSNGGLSCWIYFELNFKGEND